MARRSIVALHTFDMFLWCLSSTCDAKGRVYERSKAHLGSSQEQSLTRRVNLPHRKSILYKRIITDCGGAWGFFYNSILRGTGTQYQVGPIVFT